MSLTWDSLTPEAEFIQNVIVKIHELYELDATFVEFSDNRKQSENKKQPALGYKFKIDGKEGHVIIPNEDSVEERMKQFLANK